VNKEHGAQYSRVITLPQSPKGVVTFLYECGITCLLFQKPGTERAAGAKDIGVRERWWERG